MKLKTENLIYYSLFLLLLVVIAYPLVTLLYRSISLDGEITLRFFKQVFETPYLREIIYNTFKIGVYTTFFTVILGVTFAWVLTRVNIPGREIIHSLIIIPFLIPGFVTALAFLQLFGPVGYINKISQNLLGIDGVLFDVYSARGIILALTLNGAATVYILVKSSFEKMDATLEEAAEVSGANHWEILRDITLPLMLPAITSAALMTFLSAISNYGIVATLGYSKNFFVVTSMIFNLLNSLGETYRYNIAAVLSVLLGIVAVIIMLIKAKYLDNKNYAIVGGKSTHKKKIDLKGKYIVVAFIVFICFWSGIAPLMALIATSLTRAWGLPFTLENITMDHYKNIFDTKSLLASVITSLKLGVLTATICSVIGICVSYFAYRSKVRGRKVAEFIAMFPKSLPGIIIALAVMIAWMRPFGFMERGSALYRFSLYNTFSIILIAYIANYISTSVRATSASFTQLDVSLEEAARISGASWFTAIKDIVLPNIIGAIVSSWMLIFIPSIRELTISRLLVSPGMSTIAVTVFKIQSQGNYPLSSAIAILLILTIATLKFILYRISRK